ncbi:MAG: MFS transporter [Desulfomonilia bacterium]
MSKPALWTRDFILLSLAMFVCALPFYLLMTTMAEYSMGRFGVSEGMAGLSAGMFVIGALVSRLFVGKYMEIIGRRRILFASLAAYLLCSFLYFPAVSLGALLAVRFVHGAAFGFSSTVLTTAVMDVIPNERRGEGTGYFGLSIALATAVGPFIGFSICRHASYEALFVACALVTAVTIVMAIFVRIPEAEITQEQAAALKSFRPGGFFEKSAIPLSAVIMLMVVGYSGVVTFLNSYALSIGLSAQASLFFIFYSGAILASRPFTGRLLDLKGDNAVLCPSLLIFGASLVVLARTDSGAALLTAAAMAGLGFGTFMSCGQAVVARISPRHRIGLAMSTYFFFMDAGMGIGPYLVGSIIPLAGFRGMYLTLAGVIFSSIFLYYLVHGKRAKTTKCAVEHR